MWRVGAMITIENIYKNDYEAGNSRRDFLKGMLGAGAFVLGVSMMPRQAPVRAIHFRHRKKRRSNPASTWRSERTGQHTSSRTVRRWEMESARPCRESLRMSWTRTGPE